MRRCEPCDADTAAIVILLWGRVPTGLPSRGGDITVYVWHKPAELVHSFLLCSCVYFCLCGPFNCISFHKFSQQLSAFSFCSSGLISALLVLSTLYLFNPFIASYTCSAHTWVLSMYQYSAAQNQLCSCAAFVSASLTFSLLWFLNHITDLVHFLRHFKEH